MASRREALAQRQEKEEERVSESEMETKASVFDERDNQATLLVSMFEKMKTREERCRQEEREREERVRREEREWEERCRREE